MKSPEGGERPSTRLGGLADDLLCRYLGEDGFGGPIELLDECIMVSRPLALREAHQVTELNTRLHPGHRQGDRRPAVDAELHRVPDACT